ncbi:MAG: cysteine--tRNA ligase [Chloroflexi bacterium]|nr:cysteine--tRNA ligase [Chloroflexota bacterium]
MQLYNTLSRRLEPFEPAGPVVRLYVCGVTPYDTTHLGHARCYVVFDLLQRALRYYGHRVRYIQNITDIDDDILRKAREVGVPWDELGNRWLAVYRADVEALNLLPPAVWPRATREIPAMVEIAQALVARGHAYVREGHVYFRVRSAPDFGALCGWSRARMIARLREERFDPDDPRKEDPLDILMWQPSAPDEPAWPSPWGPGRPGWHIECTTMAYRHLGPTIDIHGGGEDLIFSHHESERVQAESFTGVRPFVRFWMYAGTVYFDGAKMSKSLGNLVLVRDLLRRYSADAVRLYLARCHYRQAFTWDEAQLAEAAALVEQLRRAAAVEQARTPALVGADPPADDPPVPRARLHDGPTAEYRARFEAALDADLDTPAAVELLAELASVIERGGAHAGEQAALLVELSEVLGLRLLDQPGTRWPDY